MFWVSDSHGRNIEDMLSITLRIGMHDQDQEDQIDKKNVVKPNVIQLKATQKQLALELDTVARCSPPTHPTPQQPFQALLDKLESCN